VTATNVGTVASSGPVVVRDVLPAGVEVLAVQEAEARAYEPVNELNETGSPIACESSVSVVTCTDESGVPPGGYVTVHVEVKLVGTGSMLAANHAEVSEVGGAGAPSAVTEGTGTAPTPVGLGVAPAGVQQFSLQAFGPAGEREVQAGSHPATIATTIAYNTVLDRQEYGEESPFDEVAEPKIENVDVPMGFIGDGLAAPRCTLAALAQEECPVDTRIGILGLYHSAGKKNGLFYFYNLVPEAGYPAEFGFTYLKNPVVIRPRVLPSAQGYVLSVPVVVPRSENAKFHEVTVTFFGDPSLADGGPVGIPFATDPDDCAAGPLTATIEEDFWTEPAAWASASTTMFESSASEGVSDCGALAFDPSIEVTPETTEVDTPSGYEVDLRVPQAPELEGDLATPDLKSAVVALPEGVSVSPGAANGLVACQASGAEGIELGDGDSIEADRVASEEHATVGTLVQEGEVLGADGLVHAAPGHCPLASQIGEVEVTTPVLEQPLKGHVYVAEPRCGGAGQPACTPASAEDGELFGLYLEVAGSGVIVKLRGDVSVNPSTGRLTTSFREAPQLPFSELKLKLNGGSRAPVANPQTCGTATTASDLTPWSTPFTADVTPLSSFVVTGCDGQPFDPTMTAGMTSTLHGGGFSPFTFTLDRADGEGDLSGVSVSLPSGLLGRISGVAECGAVEVAAETAGVGAGCPAASRVGTATAAAGAGSDPFWQSGPVFLTGPYGGGSFGLAVVVPADAGPFHLGNIVVRAAIFINPVTAAVTVGAGALPQMVDGVPLRLKTINVTVGQENNFTFNATDCTPTTIGARISSAQGASSSLSAPYNASGCAGLPFKPVFTASTQGVAGKADGASLDVRITAKQGPGEPAGTEEANIAKVDVQLPVNLPSRQSTLELACTEQQFAVNPAGCPAGSFVGTAVAHTPLLPVALEGPAILVSHAAAAFPDLVLILQGDGVVIDLTGATDIKHGITYSKFETAPDAPFEGFELKLPKGPDSLLAAYIPGSSSYDFCAGTKTVTTSKKETKKVHGKTEHITVKVKSVVAAALEMPTTITAQNGAVLTQDTKIAFTGCPTAKAARTAKKAAAAKKAARAAGRRGSGVRGRSSGRSS
jgi:hypothetical protein